MNRFFDFAVIRLAPADARGERLNIGALVFKPDGIDVRLAKRLDKVHAMSAAIDTEMLRGVAARFASMDEYARANGCTDIESRYRMLSRLGPYALSTLGKLDAFEGQYEARLESLLRDLVEPELAPKQSSNKRSSLLTQVKKAFKARRVLARAGETLDDHRIVPKYEVGEGMEADLVLKNGSYHVVETVDISRDDETLRRAISEVGISALILEQARMVFGVSQTKARLVYHASAYAERHAWPALQVAEHQGCDLLNWASADDQASLMHMAEFATPLPTRNKRNRRWTGGAKLFH